MNSGGNPPLALLVREPGTVMKKMDYYDGRYVAGFDNTSGTYVKSNLKKYYLDLRIRQNTPEKGQRDENTTGFCRRRSSSAVYGGAGVGK